MLAAVVVVLSAVVVAVVVLLNILKENCHVTKVVKMRGIFSNQAEQKFKKISLLFI